MNRDTYWQLIDDARNASAELVEVPKCLIEALSQRNEQDIVDYFRKRRQTGLKACSDFPV